MDLNDSVDNLMRRQHQESELEALQENENGPRGPPGPLHDCPAIYQLSFFRSC